MQPLSAERATPGNVDYNTVQAHQFFSAYNGTDGEQQNDWAQLVSTAAHTVSCVHRSYHALDVRIRIGIQWKTILVGTAKRVWTYGCCYCAVLLLVLTVLQLLCCSRC